MTWIETTQRFLAKNLSRWSAEFSALIAVAMTLLSLGLIDIWVVKIILTVSIFLFFAGMSHKFIVSVYKQHVLFMKEIKECASEVKKDEPNS